MDTIEAPRGSSEYARQMELAYHRSCAEYGETLARFHNVMLGCVGNTEGPSGSHDGGADGIELCMAVSHAEARSVAAKDAWADACEATIHCGWGVTIGTEQVGVKSPCGECAKCLDPEPE